MQQSQYETALAVRCANAFHSLMQESSWIHAPAMPALWARVQMLSQYRSAKHPKDSHPSHISNQEHATVFRSPLVPPDSGAALITLPPAEILFPLAEFTDKSSLLVAGSAVTFSELQSSVPERRTQKSVFTKLLDFPFPEAQSVTDVMHKPTVTSVFPVLQEPHCTVPGFTTFPGFTSWLLSDYLQVIATLFQPSIDSTHGLDESYHNLFSVQFWLKAVKRTCSHTQGVCFLHVVEVLFDPT